MWIWVCGQEIKDVQSSVVELHSGIDTYICAPSISFAAFLLVATLYGEAKLLEHHTRGPLQTQFFRRWCVYTRLWWRISALVAALRIYPNRVQFIGALGTPHTLFTVFHIAFNANFVTQFFIYTMYFFYLCA